MTQLHEVAQKATWTYGRRIMQISFLKEKGKGYNFVLYFTSCSDFLKGDGVLITLQTL